MRVILTLIAMGVSLFGQRPAKGPLRPLPSNPRWFTDGSGKAVFLAGSHVWWNLQDNNLLMPQGGDPPPVFDYDGYLDFLVRHNHNFFRMWRWEAPKWVDRPSAEAPAERSCRPHPWPRTGPGGARDGKPKFDLARFDETYFARLRSRVMAARDRGIYVAVMLFEGYASQTESVWEYHPFNSANNVNGVDGDATTYCIVQKTAMGKRILDLQEAYVRKVVDTVNDLDNVLYEICNEARAYSTPWQHHLIRYVKQLERARPKQHPVGMTSQYPDGVNATLFQSPADWISPRGGLPEENYRADPSPDTRGKVVINDTDHLGGHTQPGNAGQFNVDLTDASGSCSVEWLNVTADKTVAGQSVKGGARRTFSTPFGGPAVLYLKCGE